MGDTEINGLSPVQVGLWLRPETLVFTLLGPVAGRVVDRVGPHWPIRAGLVLARLSTVSA